MTVESSQALDVPKAKTRILSMTDLDKLNDFIVGEKRKGVLAVYNDRFNALTAKPVSPKAGNGAPDPNKKLESPADTQKERDIRSLYVEKLEHMESLIKSEQRIANFLNEPAIEKWVDDLEETYEKEVHRLPTLKVSLMKEVAPYINMLFGKIQSFKALGGSEVIVAYRRNLEEFEEKNGLLISDLKGKTLETIRKKIEGERAPKAGANA